LYDSQQTPGANVKSEYHSITECGMLHHRLAQQNEMQCQVKLDIGLKKVNHNNQYNQSASEMIHMKSMV
jgi:hypothetical protein